MLADYILQRSIQRSSLPFADGRVDAALLKRVAELDAVIFPSLSLFYSGEPTLSQYFAVEDQTLASKQRILQVGASLAASSNHPVFRAIARSAAESGITVREVETDEIGSGLTGKLEKTWYILGDESVMREEGIELGVTSRALMQQLETTGKRIIFLAQRQPKRLLGIFSCDQELVPEIIEALDFLRSLGVETQVMTGERTRLAHGVAAKLGIEIVDSELDEEAKRGLAVTLEEQGQNLAFVAPADQQDLIAGVAFPVAISSEPVDSAALTLESLSDLGELIVFAREQLQKVKKTLFWCKL